MSPASKVIIVVIVLAAMVGVIWLGSQSRPVAVENNQQPISSSAAENTRASVKSDSSNASLDADMSAVDAKLTELDADLTAVDQGLNDQPISQAE